MGDSGFWVCLAFLAVGVAAFATGLNPTWFFGAAAGGLITFILNDRPKDRPDAES